MTTAREILYLEPAFLKFIAAGNLDRVNSTLEACPSLLNAKLSNGFTPLEWAVHNNKVHIVRELLRKKADPGKVVLVAVEKEYWDCVDVFAEELQDPSDQHGFAEALFKATANKKLATMQKLIAAKASASFVDPLNKKGVLHFAGEYCNGEMIRCLVRAGARLDQEYEDKADGKLVPVRYAVRKKGKTDADWKELEAFAEEAKDDSGKYAFGEAVLFAALEHTVESSRVATVKKFIQARADVSYRFSNIHDDNTALHLAAKNGCEEMVRDLLEAGADPINKNKLGKTALDYALESNNDNIIDLFLNHVKVIRLKKQEQAEATKKEKEAAEKLAQKAAAEVEQKKQEEARAEQQKKSELEEKTRAEKTLKEVSTLPAQTAASTHDKNLGITLLNTISEDQFVVMKQIIAGKFPLDEEIDFQGKKVTALEWAVDQNKPAAVRLLLQSGANPRKYIINAANKQFWYCVDAFAEEQKDPNNEYGFGSALLRVVYNSTEDQSTRIRAIKDLIRAKASLDATFDDDCGVMHAAVLRGDAYIVEGLLKAGANPKFRNKASETAVDCALNLSRWDLVEIFVKHETEKRMRLETVVRHESHNLSVAVTHLLEGTVSISQLLFLEKHYKKTGNIGRAMLVAFFLDFYLGANDPSHLDYLKQLKCVGDLHETQQFYLACLEKKEDGLRFLDKMLSEFGYVDPITFFVLALQKENTALQKDRITTLSAQNLELVETRFRQSLDFLMQDRTVPFVKSDFADLTKRLRETAVALKHRSSSKSTYLGKVLLLAISSDFDRSTIVQEIIKQKFPLEIKIECNGKTMTALEWAALHNKPYMVRRLLDAGANPSSALGIAARADHWECVDVFIANKRLGKEIPDVDGALHCAVRKGDLARVVALLELGANQDAKNKAGETPFTIAQAMKNWDLIQAFLNKKGKPSGGMPQIEHKQEENISVKDVFPQAELGKVSAIGALARHYKKPRSVFAKKTKGRSLLYSTFFALAVGPEDPSYSEHYNYVRDFEPEKKYIPLKTFCVELLNNPIFVALLNLGFDLNLQFGLFVLDNELEKALTGQNHTSLSKRDLAVVKAVLEESIASVCRDAGTHDTYVEELRDKTTRGLKKFSSSVLPANLVAQKFLSSEKGRPVQPVQLAVQEYDSWPLDDFEFEEFKIQQQQQPEMQGPQAYVAEESSSLYPDIGQRQNLTTAIPSVLLPSAPVMYAESLVNVPTSYAPPQATHVLDVPASYAPPQATVVRAALPSMTALPHATPVVNIPESYSPPQAAVVHAALPSTTALVNAALPAYSPLPADAKVQSTPAPIQIPETTAQPTPPPYPASPDVDVTAYRAYSTFHKAARNQKPTQEITAEWVAANCVAVPRSKLVAQEDVPESPVSEVEVDVHQNQSTKTFVYGS